MKKKKNIYKSRTFDKVRDKRPSWDEYFLGITQEVAKRATCDRGRSGCIIVRDKKILATGYVGSPSGLPHCDEGGHMLRDMIAPNGSISKHCIRTIHAEQNAICQAARFGIILEGATLYCTMEPCFTCFPKGEYVYNDFMPVKVENVTEKNLLFSLTGKAKIEKIFKREYNGKILILKPRGFFPIKITPEHPILIYDGKKIRARLRVNSVYKYQNKSIRPIDLKEQWMAAGDVKVGDYLILPKIKERNSYTIDFKSYTRYPWSERMNEKMRKLQDLDKAFAWFLGFYVAEGHACSERRGGVRIYLGKHEKMYIKKLIKISKSRFGCATVRQEKTSTVILINSGVLGRFLRQNFGANAYEKRLPSWFFGLSEDIIHGFLQGYISGDGALSTTNYGYNYIEISTSSKYLPFQLPLLFAKLDIVPSIYEAKTRSSKINGRVIKRKSKSYTIMVAGKSVKKIFNNAKVAKIDKKHYIEKGNSLLIPIVKKEYGEYNGTVFNFETTDNTYCIPFVVHNCAKMIVNCGIKRVVCKKRYHAADQTRDLLKKAKVKLDVVLESIARYKDQK